MKTRARFPIRFLILAAVLAVAGEVSAHSDPYKVAVKRIEKDFHAKKRGVPFLGVANFVLKFWHPAGIKNVKVALFEDQDLQANAGSEDFGSAISKSIGNAWSPMVQVYSKPRHEWTYIYYSDPGKDMKVLVVSVEHREAVVAQVKFEPEKLVQFLQRPDVVGVSVAHQIKQGPNGDTSPPSVAGDDASLPLPYETSPGRSPDAGMAAMPKSKPELKRTPGEEEPSLIPASDETREGSTVNPAAGLGADRVATGKAAIRLGTTLVNLSVKTTDNSGRVVAGLKKDDFQVFENGSPQEIAYFDANTSPVNVLLMLDLSGSTHDRMKVLKKAAETFVDRLGTDDQIGVATFTGRFRYVSAFTRDHRQVKHQIGKIKNREGGTRFYDAMWSGLDIADAIQGRRKAIIVLTDGVDNSLQDPKEYPTTHTFSDLADRAAEDDVTIYPIYIDTEGDRSARSIGRRIHEIYSTARAQLGTLADDTAGTLLKTHDAGDLKDAYAQVAEELHTVYSIAYSPAAAATKPEWRKVAVKIDRPGVVVKTRAGYHTK